ncbi:MAG: ATP-binding protein [bacterium]
MKKYKIFISGVQKELKEERRVVKGFISNDTLLRDHFDAFLFEDHPANCKPSGAAYLDEVCKCDIYIGILGEKYGNIGRGKMSPTEVEFREAKKKHKIVLIYIRGKNSAKDKEREKGVQKLIKEIKHPELGYSYRRFDNANELKSLVYESLIVLLREQGFIGKAEFDQQVCIGATLKDIDSKKVRWFLEKAKEVRGFDVPVKITIKETLERLGLLKDGGITNTAVLLFGKNPQRFFIQASVRCGRIKGNHGYDFLDMKVIDGSIPEQREHAIKFITENTKHAVYFDSNQRYDKWEYPLRALEEIITNALAHRDYFSNADIHLTVYDNRIEIWNPGELPKPLRPQDLKRQHKSIPRNKLLAHQLFLVKHIEHWGMGTNRVIEEMRQNNLPDPVFENLSGGFQVILMGPGKSFERMIEETKLNKIKLNYRQKKAIEFIKQNMEISRKQYVNLAKISVRQANRDLNDLLNKKIIVSVGSGRSLRYKWSG